MMDKEDQNKQDVPEVAEDKRGIMDWIKASI